ncbi:ABC transporter permease subunit [Sphingomonas sp. HF-S4]|uniref:ABC transporter permease subunit n=1 Tax=Sphingomonas agrestis TaxID=3080540 RepID=A0ABU3YA99_9SPHN|nr:ABC transporter permease subunit [Sphingomonas sp. HF-S4]MDV3458314.1 ABC transporter permease subunit [Sphingomonas sp. HF-S4]
MTIAQLEGIRAWRDPVLRIALVLFALLACYAAFTGARWAESRESAVHQAVAEAAEITAKRRESFAATLAKGEQPNFGLIYATALPFRAGLPGAPLAAVSAGQAEGYPAAASIAPFLDPYTIFDAHMAGLESPSVLAAGRFDLAFVIVVLLPLLLIAATYDFWSRDVENGSARFQLAQPVTPGQLILARAVVRGGSLLVGAVLIAVAALLLTGARDAGDLARFAAVVLAYGAFWIALTSLINLVVRASTTAALASGTAWLAIVVLLPGAIAAAADLSAPPPSDMAYTNAIRTAGLEVRAANAAAARVAATGEPRNLYPASLWHSRGEIAQRDARLGPIHRAHAGQRDAHRGLAEGLRFLSPAVIAQDALDRIAGTDATRAIAFQDQARQFAGAARRLAFDWMDSGRLMTLADYDGGLPRFAFAEPSRAAPLAADLIALLLLTTLLLTLAALRLRGGAAKLL